MGLPLLLFPPTTTRCPPVTFPQGTLKAAPRGKRTAQPAGAGAILGGLKVGTGGGDYASPPSPSTCSPLTPPPPQARVSRSSRPPDLGAARWRRDRGAPRPLLPLRGGRKRRGRAAPPAAAGRGRGGGWSRASPGTGRLAWAGRGQALGRACWERCRGSGEQMWRVHGSLSPGDREERETKQKLKNKKKLKRES